MFYTWTVQRTNHVIMRSEISADFTYPSDASSSNLEVAILPPIENHLVISISIIIDTVLICPELTPNLANYLKKLLQNSRLFTNLKFKAIIELGDLNVCNSSFVIKLYDELFDVPTINDLLLSPSEQKNLNNLSLQTIKLIKIKIHYSSIGEFPISEFLKNDSLLNDLNYSMFQNFIYLESKFPLIFNYISRSTYSSSRDFISSIINASLKSNETQLLQQRSILSGLIKNLNHSKTWLQYINQWDSRKIQRQLNNHDSFTITWFVKSSHASL